MTFLVWLLLQHYLLLSYLFMFTRWAYLCWRSSQGVLNGKQWRWHRNKSKAYKENTAICERKIKSIWKIGCNRYMTEILGIDCCLSYKKSTNRFESSHHFWSSPPIYLHWDFRNLWHSPVWNNQFDELGFFPSLKTNWIFLPVQTDIFSKFLG